jgi:hypothetical protein
MSNSLIDKILTLDNRNLFNLFKPVQIEILKKIKSGASLTENEKRYLRGGLRKKLDSLQALTTNVNNNLNSLGAMLEVLGEYYITGYEALKHNGFGWYFESKRILVLNTRLDGRLHIDGRIIILKRVKSIGRPSWTTDKKSGLKYATNSRVIRDAIRFHQDDILKICVDFLQRYGKMFVPRPEKYTDLLPKALIIENPRDYGV